MPVNHNAKLVMKKSHENLMKVNGGENTFLYIFCWQW